MPNATFNIPVPPGGDGPIVDISSLVGSKTVILTGFFSGSYTLLVSNDGVHYVPALLFNSDGHESIKQTLKDAYQFARLRSNANTVGTVTCNVTGTSAPGENFFLFLPPFLPGGAQQSTIINTWAFFPPTGLEQGINFLCEGSFTGVILVEGSADGAEFDVIGTFQAGPQQRVLVGIPPVLEFEPLSTPNKTQYLRLTLQGQAFLPVFISLGGRIPATSATGNSSLTLVSESDGAAAREINTDASTEVILYEDAVNLSSSPANVTLQLDAIVQVQGPTTPTGRFRVYLGANAPGDTTGGTLAVDSGDVVSTSEIDISVSGLPVANPGGLCLVQITGEVSPPGAGAGTNEADIRGVNVYRL